MFPLLPYFRVPILTTHSALKRCLHRPQHYYRLRQPHSDRHVALPQSVLRLPCLTYCYCPLSRALIRAVPRLAQGSASPRKVLPAVAAYPHPRRLMLRRLSSAVHLYPAFFRAELLPPLHIPRFGIVALMTPLTDFPAGQPP